MQFGHSPILLCLVFPPAKKKGAKDAADQSKVFAAVLKRFHWAGRPVGQERCGWCHNCQTTAQRKACLMTLVGEKVASGAPPLQGGSRTLTRKGDLV